MSVKNALKRVVKNGLEVPGAIGARLLARTQRAPRFSQVFETREAAIASLPREQRSGYDDANIAEVSFLQMCQRQSWDYPLLYWMQKVLPEVPVVVDAGGHLGTKYIAFSEVIDLTRTKWVVYDLPGIISAARTKQGQDALPAAITFVDNTDALPDSDLLIASGLLQYLDLSFAAFVGQLGHRPKYILLNKVAMRDGPGLFTVERIGAGRVPYQVRSKAQWEQEVAEMGYQIHDTWSIPNLGHVISTHPWLGRSESRGYFLVRAGESL